MKAMILFIATFGVLSASAQPLPSLQGEGSGVGPVSDTLRLTLDDCIAMARRQSIDAAVALGELRSAYWQWRSYRADQLVPAGRRLAIVRAQ